MHGATANELSFNTLKTVFYVCFPKKELAKPHSQINSVILGILRLRLPAQCVPICTIQYCTRIRYTIQILLAYCV
jgi:hypothetical protein